MTPAVDLLTGRGVAFGLHRYAHDPGRDDWGIEAAEALGVDPAAVLKTLLVEVAGGATGRGDLVVVVLPVSAAASMRAVSVAAAVGAKRAALCPPARAERATGYVVGGISPLGQRTRCRTVLDASASSLEVVYVSAGRRGLEVSLAPGDLVDVLGATVAPVTG